MEATDYLLRADECLKRVATWLEDFDPDEVDFEEADGVLKLVFPDGKVYVLNRQAGSSQMWFAAEARAWRAPGRNGPNPPISIGSHARSQ